MIGTPLSCMSAVYASDWEAVIGPKPGKPGVFTYCPLIWLPFRSVRFPAESVTGKLSPFANVRLPPEFAAPARTGWRYLWPKMAS